jgi:hypothetical protein
MGYRRSRSLVEINQLGCCALEKLSPHFGLADVGKLIRLGQIKATRSARERAVALGIDFQGMIEVVAKLTFRDFYKSMTTQTTQSGKTSITPKRQTVEASI